MKPFDTVVPILMYHEVAGPPDTRSRLAVSPVGFAQQLAYLHEAGFTTVTLSALAAVLASGTAELPDRPIVLTFDDGSADFLTTALPLLQEHDFTATLFVTTGWIADAGPAARPRPARMLSWQQVRVVAELGVEIGAHSHTHAELDQLSDDQLGHELGTSRDLLEDRLGGPIQGLAYPFGYSNIRVRRAARAVGYTYACVVGNRISDPMHDLFALPRLTVKRSTQQRTFVQMVRGQHVPMIFAKERVLTKGWAMVRRCRATLSR